jgi:type VI secretion system protein ImpE
MNEYVAAYRRLLDADEKRQRLYVRLSSPTATTAGVGLESLGYGAPGFLFQPTEDLSLRVKALECLRANKWEQAVDWLDEADARSENISGHVDGREFDDFRDTDDLFGPVLELLIEDEYVWFPAAEVRSLRIGKFESLRDRLFVPAQLTAMSGEQWHTHLPAIYPATVGHADDALRSGLATDWHAEDDGPIRGIGLKMFRFGEEELSLFDFTHWEGRRVTLR